MGTGATTLSSEIPERIDRKTAETLAGNQFDGEAFDAVAGDGTVSREAYLAAARKAVPIATQCEALCFEFNKRIAEVHAAAAAASRDVTTKLAAQKFWEEQEGKPLWIVPMGEDSTFAQSCGFLVALDRAHRAGRTPLLVDNSRDHVIDTFFSYRDAQILETKKLLLDERQGMVRPAVLERTRTQLVKAMRSGQVLYVRLTNTACDFCSRYNGADTLPLELFDAQAVATLNREFGAGVGGDGASEEVGTNLWGASSPFATVLRESDTNHGVFVPRRGFQVVLCTHIGVSNHRNCTRIQCI
jgi:hypothetical protein